MSLIQCDGCEKYIDDSTRRRLRVPTANLDLCELCYETESKLINEQSEQSTKFGEGIPLTEDEKILLNTDNEVIPEPLPASYTGYFAPFKIEENLNARLKHYVMEKHQEYFNQEIERNANLTIEQLRDRILELAEEYHGAETEAIRIKTKMHGASSQFNDLKDKLSDYEKKEIRENDKLYVPAPLANPLKQAAKRKKITKDAESNLRALFPNFNDEQITAILIGKK